MKHAFLIMAHNNFAILERLLLLLDNEKNDIYLHVDKKCIDFNFAYYEKLLKRSKLIYVTRINVRWGDVTLIECEYILFETALKTDKYTYFHLLSGGDLPIKSMDFIHSFFKKEQGKEFISFVKDGTWNQNRIRHLWYTKHLRTSNYLIKCFNQVIHLLLKGAMHISRYDRVRDSFGVLKKGDEWVSLTENAVLYLVSQKKMILMKFKYSIYADEVYKQTLLYNSEFVRNIYNFDDKTLRGDCLREIDWFRGNPYVYKLDDLPLLLSSKALFARKFDKRSLDLVDIIVNHFIKNE